ncbi:MAG: hypothetical protein JNN08_31050 [Bryobacterales bacterium]|nr:hypothetical protein [Bryobacterales bacterium]
MKQARRLAILVAAASAVFGQPAEFLSTPRLGWTVSDDARELRALLGVPGAGRVSEAVTLPDGVTRIYVAPGHQYALGYGEDSGAWCLVSLRDESLFSVTKIEGLSGPAGLLAFGPDARAVAVADAANSTVQVLTVSAGRAQAAWTVAIDSPSRIALDSSGDLLLAAGAGGVILHRRDAPGIPVAPATDVEAMAFRAGTDRAIIADSAQRVLLLADHLAAEPAVRPVVGAGIGAPGAVAWSRDGRFVWCADREANAIARVELATGVADLIQTDVSVSQFEVLPGSDHFLISAPRAGQAAWMLLANPERVSTYFVPGVPVSEERNHEIQ